MLPLKSQLIISSLLQSNRRTQIRDVACAPTHPISESFEKTITSHAKLANINWFAYQSFHGFCHFFVLLFIHQFVFSFPILCSLICSFVYLLSYSFTHSLTQSPTLVPAIYLFTQSRTHTHIYLYVAFMIYKLYIYTLYITTFKTFFLQPIMKMMYESQLPTLLN